MPSAIEARLRRIERRRTARHDQMRATLIYALPDEDVTLRIAESEHRPGWPLLIVRSDFLGGVSR